MGKYNEDFEEFLNIFLQRIANELAEANRLKRLEIKSDLSNNNQVHSRDYLNTLFKELEDQA